MENIVSLCNFRGKKDMSQERYKTIPERVTALETSLNDLHAKFDILNNSLDNIVETFKFAKYGSKLIYICAKTAAWIGGTTVAVLSALELWTRFIHNNFPFK